ncbi:hypothetical protein BC826DRAFT_1133945, partial [Russula brevipes]
MRRLWENRLKQPKVRMKAQCIPLMISETHRSHLVLSYAVYFIFGAILIPCRDAMVPSDSKSESSSDQDDTRSGNDGDDQNVERKASNAYNAQQIEHRASSAQCAECGASDTQQVEHRASIAQRADAEHGVSDAQLVEHEPSAHEPSPPVPLSIISTPTRMGQRRKVRDMSGLSMCLCGDHAQAGNASSIQCQRAGCETSQYHLRCVGYEDARPRNWTCEPC